MTARRMLGAVGAQISAQVLTGSTLLVHMSGWPEVSVWVVAPLIAAAIVPFKHNGSLKDRAAGNFGAGIILAGFFWWELFDGGLDLVGGGGFELPVQGMLMLAAAVLFSVAGAVFWMMREESGQ